MSKFRKKPVVIEAVQLDNDGLVRKALGAFYRHRAFARSSNTDLEAMRAALGVVIPDLQSRETP